MKYDYKKIEADLNAYAKNVLENIKKDFSDSFSVEQKAVIDTLISEGNSIVVDEPTKENIEFFSKQSGVRDSENYDKKYLPTAHGGRTKGDNKIHVYPDSPSYMDCETSEEVSKKVIDDILVHEIFHYFIRPDKNEEQSVIENRFGSFLTEGLVQLYAEEYSKVRNLKTPQSNYGKNVSFARELLGHASETMSSSEINKRVFQDTSMGLVNTSSKGKEMYEKFKNDFFFHRNVNEVASVFSSMLHFNDHDRLSLLRHFDKIDDRHKLIGDLLTMANKICESNPEILEDLKKGICDIDPQIYTEITKNEIKM